MVHCSGGAQTKILHFVDNLHIIKNNLFSAPLFKLIQSESGTTWHEIYKVFNIGHQIEFYVPETIASKIISISKEFQVDVQIIRRVEKAKSKILHIQSEFGEFVYH